MRSCFRDYVPSAADEPEATNKPPRDPSLSISICRMADSQSAAATSRVYTIPSDTQSLVGAPLAGTSLAVWESRLSGR